MAYAVEASSEGASFFISLSIRMQEKCLLQACINKQSACWIKRTMMRYFHVSFFRDSGMKMRDLWDKKVKDEFCERFIYIKEFG